MNEFHLGIFYGVGARQSGAHIGHGLKTPAVPRHAAKHVGAPTAPTTGMRKAPTPQQVVQQAAQAAGPPLDP